MHPFLTAGILGINSGALREDLLPGHREVFVRILERDCDTSAKVLFLWGKLDATVPYRMHSDKVRGWAENHKNLTFVTLQKIGHEAVCEDSKVIADAVIEFLQN